MIFLYIFFSILALGGKLTFFGWLLYEKLRGANSVTLLLMAFFALLSIEHLIILSTLLTHIGMPNLLVRHFELPIVALYAMGILNSIFLVFVMIGIIVVLLEAQENRSAVNVD